jgi:hypothetical protein
MSLAQIEGESPVSLPTHGYLLVRGEDFPLADHRKAWEELTDDWNHLEIDAYMSDKGRYRRRRYGRFFFVPATSEVQRLKHAPVFQSKSVNGFAGGIQRDFAPLRESTFANPALLALIRRDFSPNQAPSASQRAEPWEVWVHQIRIETTIDDVGYPAPEGIHHDGHDFIAMHLVKKDNVRGGTSMIYDNDRKPLYSCMLERPLDTIYADDHRVMHNVEPIEALSPDRPAKRDVLILDYDYKPGLLRSA